MADNPYDEVLVLLGEPNRQVRRSVADSIRHQGFRGVKDTSEFQAIREAVQQDQVDVLICDMDLESGMDLCGFIRDIRHGAIGNNPFMVTIALTADLSPPVIRRIVDSGTDDIVSKPISVGTLLDRLGKLGKSRKGFVVTTDYIGPNRRKEHRPGTMPIPEIEVPNPMRFRAEGGVDKAAFDKAIGETSQLINSQKMERHAFQIDYLVRQIVPQYDAGTQDEKTAKFVARLRLVAQDLVQRMQGTEREHVSELATAVIDVAKSIGKSPLSPDMKDVRLLPQLGAAVKQAFSVDQATIAAAHDITESLKKGRGR